MEERKQIAKKDLEFETFPPPKKCFRCDGETMKGLFYGMGDFRSWVKKYPEEPNNPVCIVPKYPVSIIACKKCGYTEIYTDFRKAFNV
ncbi:MAG: hypothetical protein ACKKMR_01255 [Candidatus Nealsonbacteria bacterium]